MWYPIKYGKINYKYLQETNRVCSWYLQVFRFFQKLLQIKMSTCWNMYNNDFWTLCYTHAKKLRHIIWAMHTLMEKSIITANRKYALQFTHKQIIQLLTPTNNFGVKFHLISLCQIAVLMVTIVHRLIIVRLF